MAAFDTTAISQNIVWIIIVVIAAIVVIIAFSEWRKVREAQNNVALVEKQVELKKISLVEKDLETKRMMENVIPLPKDQQEQLANIRQGTSDIMHKVGYLHSEIGERVARLEAKAEYGKLQKLMKDLEKKEAELDKKMEDSAKGRK
jgi:SH3-like domain-containing protein